MSPSIRREWIILLVSPSMRRETIRFQTGVQTKDLLVSPSMRRETPETVTTKVCHVSC